MAGLRHGSNGQRSSSFITASIRSERERGKGNQLTLSSGSPGSISSLKRSRECACRWSLRSAVQCPALMGWRQGHQPRTWPRSISSSVCSLVLCRIRPVESSGSVPGIECACPFIRDAIMTSGVRNRSRDSPGHVFRVGFGNIFFRRVRIAPWSLADLNRIIS